MANEKVLCETEKVLAMMEESEEKVSVLNQDLKENESFCLQMKQNLKELRQFNINNSADLEYNENLKSNIKNWNVEFVTFAQKIYSCGEELYADLNLRQTELDKIEEMFNKNEDKFIEKFNYFKLEEEKMNAKLEVIAQEEIKDNEKKALEFQKLNTENEELINELSNIDMEIVKYENLIKEDEELDRLEAEYRKEIEAIEQNIKMINVEINTISELLENTDRNRQMATIDTENHITELDKQLDEVRNEILVASRILADNKFDIEELNSKLKDIENDKEKKENLYDQYNKDLYTIEICMKKAKENMENEVNYCEKSILEYEELSKIQKELNEKIKKEITSFKVKIEIEAVENNKIVMDINSLEERKTKLDLNGELDANQNELKQLKTTRQDLKEQYNRECLRIQNEMKTIQAKIESIETKNKNLQNEIDKVIAELKQIRDEEVEKIKEKLSHEEKSKELDTQVEKLTFELARAKAESIKNKQKTADFKIMAMPKHFLIPNATNKGKKETVEHHWDSDSSMEGENRRFSELAKQKIKIRRVSK